MALSPEDIDLGGIVARYAVEDECPADRTFTDRFLGRRLCYTVYRIVGSATTEETRADVGSFASQGEAERFAEKQSRKDRELGARYSDASTVFEPADEDESEDESDADTSLADTIAETVESIAAPVPAGDADAADAGEPTAEAIEDAAARGNLADSESHQPNAPAPAPAESVFDRLIKRARK